MSNFNPNLVRNLGSARAGEGGTYFKHGHNFHVVFEKCQWKVARDRTEYTIFDFQVINSDCPLQGPGAKPSAMINMSNDSGAGNLGELLRYALSQFARTSEGVIISVDDDDYWGSILDDRETLEGVLGEPQMLVGTELFLYTRPTRTRPGGKYTVHEWSLEPTNGEVGVDFPPVKTTTP